MALATDSSVIPSKAHAFVDATSNSKYLFGIKRHFTKFGRMQDVFDSVEWEKRKAEIKDETGKVVFVQRDVEFPKFWTQRATDVVVNKYFRGKNGSPQRETSLKQVIGRIVGTITKWASEQGYFADADMMETFEAELAYINVHQYAAFNSPVWFNVGVEPHPQVSACFINSIDDTMDSIIDRQKAEMTLFKQGSGSGINFSPLRSSFEFLSAGGQPSGPVSFMKGFDSNAGVVSSGGKTRRAAKMACLNVDHPDILETANGGPGFIRCKAAEEKKAHALVEAGWDADFTKADGAYANLQFQNANNSVRVSDEFMKAVEDNKTWTTHLVTTKEPHKTYSASALFREIAEAAWQCGDPGLQFDTTIHKWHTCKASGRINASNPCSEYMFLDDTACNLASMRLMRFRNNDGTLDVESFKHCTSILTIAQDAIVDPASYPTKEISEKNPKYRTIGLGYADLGAYLMSIGVPYDSQDGRNIAAAITSLMCGHSYFQSSKIAEVLGTFSEYQQNRASMESVIHQHRDAAFALSQISDSDLYSAAIEAWNKARASGLEYGYRNAQVTVIAPTGTIGYAMDCDTTGCEPELALVKYKRLVGGGTMKIVNNTVARGLQTLGYTAEQIQKITEHVGKTGSIEGAPELMDKHLPVFDCSFATSDTGRAIAWTGHIDMLAAIQPFVSGSISKTVNLPKSASVDDVADAYMRSWKKGLKCVAVYRDGCKASQPLNVKLDPTTGKRVKDIEPSRRKLPDNRPSHTHKFNIGGQLEGYLQIGFYPDTLKIGELFINVSKSGSTLRGLMDAFATQTSIALQYGVPFSAMVEKFSFAAFEPSGFTTDDSVRNAKSVVDYIFRFVNARFPDGKATPEAILGIEKKPEAVASAPTTATPSPVVAIGAQSSTVALPSNGAGLYKQTFDAPPCGTCGAFMVRNGACYKCDNCGSTSGCS